MPAFTRRPRISLILALIGVGMAASCGRDTTRGKIPDPFPEAAEQDPSRRTVSNTSVGLEGLIWGALKDPTPGTQLRTLNLDEFLESSSDLLILASGCVGGRLRGENDCVLAVQNNGGSPYLYSTRLERATTFDDLGERVGRLGARGDAVRALLGDEKNGFTIVSQAPEFGARAPRFEHEWVRASSRQALAEALASRARSGWWLSGILKIPNREEYGAVISKLKDSQGAFELRTVETTQFDRAVRELSTQGFIVRGVSRSKPIASEPATAFLIAYRMNSGTTVRATGFSADYRSGSREEWSIAEHASVRGKIMVSAIDLERCVLARDGAKTCFARTAGYRY